MIYNKSFEKDCSSDQFQCADICIPNWNVKDGKADCSDRSDEKYSKIELFCHYFLLMNIFILNGTNST